MKEVGLEPSLEGKVGLEKTRKGRTAPFPSEMGYSLRAVLGHRGSVPAEARDRRSHVCPS